MKVSSSDNSYSSASYSNKGMSGMVSGMDTEGIVQSMLSGIQTKIDKQEQRQQVLEWQQEEYREVIDKINEFKDKYLTASGSNSLLMSSNLNTITAQSSSSAVKVTTTSDSVDGSFDIKVNQLAENAKFTSTSTVCSQIGSDKSVKIDSASDIMSQAKSSIEIETDGKIISIDINGAISNDDIVSRINSGIEKYNKANGTSVSISASLDSNKKIVYSGTGDNVDFKVDGQSAGIEKTATLQTGAYNGKNTVTISCSGKNLEIDLNGKSDIVDAINSAISADDSTLKDSGITVSSVDGKLKFSAAADTSFRISGTASGLASIGFEKSVSSEDGTVTATENFEAANNKIIINGTEISLSDGDTAEKIAQKINDANISGVSVSVSGETLKFTSTGPSPDVKVEGTSADLAKFGLNNESKAEMSSEYTTEPEEIKSLGTLRINYNGVQKGITITDTDTLDSFRDKIYSAFGSSVKVEDDGTVNVGTGKTISFSGSKEALDYLGISEKGSSNYFSTSDSIEDAFGVTDTDKFDFKINGIDFLFSKSVSVSDMMSQINDSRAGVTISYNSLNDKFSIKTNESGADAKLDISDGAGGLISKMFGTTGISETGKDASVTIDGENIQYGGNDITYNGLNITLRQVTDGPVTIESSKDTGKALDTIVSFVEDYNKLIEDLNKRIHEEATYKKYPPLTDAQEDQMTDKEIEKWNEKAKTGLLSKDSDISKFLQEMRTAIYTKIGDTPLLSDIGISSSSTWSDYGKLTIDKDKLTEALENDLKGVTDIFTGRNGLATRLSNACKKAASTSSASPGTIVSRAGAKGKATEKNNTIYNQINSIKDKIKRLKEQYESRKTRYWDQFNSMESTLSNMNSTSSWISSMLGV